MPSRDPHLSKCVDKNNIDYLIYATCEMELDKMICRIEDELTYAFDFADFDELDEACYEIQWVRTKR